VKNLITRIHRQLPQISQFSGIVYSPGIRFLGGRLPLVFTRQHAFHGSRRCWCSGCFTWTCNASDYYLSLKLPLELKTAKNTFDNSHGTPLTVYLLQQNLAILVLISLCAWH